MAMAAAASSSLVSIRSDRRTNSGCSRHGNCNSTTVTCRASFPFSGRTISIASPSCSSRFISVLSSPSQVRSRRTTQIFALDPDFYKIPYVEGVPVGKKLKIWNLPPNTDPQEFRQWFDGLEGVSVESVEFTDDPELNSQGIGGFIEFGTKQEACMAIVRRDGYKFKGKCVRMDFVEKKPHEREIGGRRNRPTYRSSSFSPSNSRMGSSSPSSGSYGGSSSGYGSGANSNPSFASASASSAPVSRMGNNEPTTFKPYGNTPNITSSTNLNTNANMNNVSNLSPTTRSYGAEPSPAANDSGSSGFSGSKDSLFGSGSGSYVSPPSFGAPSNTPSSYGGTNAPIQSTPNYGAGSSTSSYGSPSSTYGNTPSYGNTPGYGNTPSYGNPPSTPNYGNTQPAPGYGNTPSTPSFGNTPSTSSFGNTPASSGYGQSPASSYPQMSDDKPFGLNSNNLGDVDSKSSSSTSSYGSQPISTPNYGVNNLQSNSSYGDNKSYGGSTQSRSSYGSMDYGQSIASTPFSGGNEPSSFGANSNMSFGGSSDSSSSYGAYSSSGTGYGRSEYSQSYGNSEPRPSYGGYGSSPRPSSTNRIFVGNLPWSTDDMSLQQLFSEFGAVLEARVVKDRETGRSRGFGFISMSTADEMNAAIQGLDGRQVDGRAIRVNQAESRF